MGRACLEIGRNLEQCQPARPVEKAETVGILPAAVWEPPAGIPAEEQGSCFHHLADSVGRNFEAVDFELDC